MHLDFNTLKNQIENTIETQKNGEKYFNVQGRLIRLPETSEAVIVGDLHGDLNSLITILKKSRFYRRVRTNPDFLMIFLGDYVDRGPKQLEVLIKLMELLEKYPENIILIRGNHEGPQDIRISPHEFPQVLTQLYGENADIIYMKYRELFDNLYNAVLIEDQALLVHGGIPTEASTLDDIAYAHETHPKKPHLVELLWNDPSTLQGVNYSFRGVGKQFGVDIVERFLSQIGAKMLIRGHECFDDGYYFHEDKVLTLFSCKLPVYRNRYAAYVDISQNISYFSDVLRNHIHQF